VSSPSPRDLADWNPGLDNGGSSLLTVYEAMPKNSQTSIPWYVKLWENPRSPLALAGAVDLFGHDCIHILLGRGLLQQDEAFVIGFTMGASGSCSRFQQALLGSAARHLYRQPYRFNRLERDVFDFSVVAGRTSGALPLHAIDYRVWLERPLGQLRRALNLDVPRLLQLYAAEASRWHGTAASARLPTPAGRFSELQARAEALPHIPGPRCAIAAPRWERLDR
jgi:hypothetical protein